MAAPVNTVAPVISGTQEVGNTISVSTGTWTGGVTSYAYQWQEQFDSTLIWTNIAGAISSQHLIIADDTGYKLRCAVTATNNTGSTVAYSNETIVIPEDWFIVEDGTAKSNALSYVSIAEADTYHARRNNTSWALLTVGEKKAFLVKATEYLIQAYRMRWKGIRVSAEQSLDWPRNFVQFSDYEAATLNGTVIIGGYYYYPADEVPTEVKQACADMALKAISSELNQDLSQGVVREKVDVIEISYDALSPQYVRYRAIDQLLAPLLQSIGANHRVRRT